MNTHNNIQSNTKKHHSDCPGCGSTSTYIFHHIESTPVNSVLKIRSRENALNFPRGEMAIAFCRTCGFIYNSSFDPGKVHYSSECEESQGYSPTFSAFARDLAKHLVEKHDLKGKRIIEIGCGKGEFLKLICGLGGCSGVGFDPAFVPGRGEDSHKMPEKIEFIADYYSEKYAHYHGDMICCRMTLEHIANAAEFMQSVRNSIGDRLETVVLFQVPDVTRILNQCAFEDIYYEHCSYFSPGSLSRLFRSACFEITDIKIIFEEQYLMIEARPSAGKTIMKFDSEDDLSLMQSLVAKFQKVHPAIMKFWDNLVQEVNRKGGRAVIWGSGSKGVAFLNALPNSNKIECAVDIHPHRQGTYMAGTGQQIVAPEFLKSYPPTAVIVMNSIYIDEITGDLKRLGLDPEIYSLGEQT